MASSCGPIPRRPVPPRFVIFQPGALDARKLLAALTQNDKIICTARTGDQNPGLRLAPHFYNTMEEMDRAVAAIRKYLVAGV